MPAACALGMISGKIIFYFEIAERLRTLRYLIFTGGVVKENGICSACFLRKQRRCGRYPLRRKAGRGMHIFPQKAGLWAGQSSALCKKYRFPLAKRRQTRYSIATVYHFSMVKW